MSLDKLNLPFGADMLCSSLRKTPGTEDGVLEPIPTFSTCYSAPFIVLHVGDIVFRFQFSSDRDIYIAWPIR